MPSISIRNIDRRSDPRGIGVSLSLRALAFLGAVAELHYVTLRPGAVRGNHAHRGRLEVMLVSHEDAFELAWQAPGGEAETMTISGRGALEIELPDDVAHALRNTGCSPLHVVSCSSARPVEGDTRTVDLL